MSVKPILRDINMIQLTKYYSLLDLLFWMFFGNIGGFILINLYCSSENDLFFRITSVIGICLWAAHTVIYVYLYYKQVREYKSWLPLQYLEKGLR